MEIFINSRFTIWTFIHHHKKCEGPNWTGVLISRRMVKDSHDLDIFDFPAIRSFIRSRPN